MNAYFSNRWFKTGQFVLVILFALTLSSCDLADARPGVVKATQQAVDMKALAAAEKLTNDGQAVAVDILVINAVLSKLPDTKMLYNQAKELAVYAAPMSKNTAGLTTWRYVFIDTAHVAICDFAQTITKLGGNPTELNTIKTLNAFLSGAGFKEVSTEAAVIAALVQSSRLAVGFLRSLGSTTIEVIVVPAYFFTPEVNPFIHEGIQQ